MNGMARSDLNVEMNAAANSADIPSRLSSSLSAGSGLAIAVGKLYHFQCLKFNCFDQGHCPVHFPILPENVQKLKLISI